MPYRPPVPQEWKIALPHYSESLTRHLQYAEVKIPALRASSLGGDHDIPSSRKATDATAQEVHTFNAIEMLCSAAYPPYVLVVDCAPSLSPIALSSPAPREPVHLLIVGRAQPEPGYYRELLGSHSSPHSQASSSQSRLLPHCIRPIELLDLTGALVMLHRLSD